MPSWVQARWKFGFQPEVPTQGGQDCSWSVLAEKAGKDDFVVEAHMGIVHGCGSA